MTGLLDALLLQLPYYLCSVAAFVTAGVAVAAVRKGLRPAWLLLGALAFAALGVAFFLIAATAAPGGHIARSAVAGPIRWLHLVGGLLWCAVLLLLVRATVRIER